MPFTRLLAAAPCCFKDGRVISFLLSLRKSYPILLKMAPNSHITTRELCERNRYCSEDGNNAVFPLPARHRRNRRFITTDSSTLSADSRAISQTQLKDTWTSTSLTKLYTAGRAERNYRLCFLEILLDLFFVVSAARYFHFVFLCHQLIPLNSMLLQFIVMVLNV